MVIVIMVSAIMLSAIMPSVIMLSVVAPFAIAIPFHPSPIFASKAGA